MKKKTANPNIKKTIFQGLINTTSRNEQPLWRRARYRAVERALFANRPATDGDAPLRSYSNRVARLGDLALWLWEQEFDAMITINSNDTHFDYRRGRSALKKLDAFLDHFFLRKSWCKYPSPQRTLFFAVPEHAGGELHYHIFIKIPSMSRRSLSQLTNIRPTLTEVLQAKKIFPRGDADMRRLSGFSESRDSWHRFRTACYVVKGLWQAVEWEQCLIGSEFHNQS